MPSLRHQFRLGVFAVVCGMIAAPSYGGGMSPFDTDNEGWTVVNLDPTVHTGNPTGFTPATWDGGFGAPAGSLRAGAEYDWTWLAAPAS